MTRPLARIVFVDEIKPVPGADRIEVARVGGWNCVVRKGEFTRGDVAVFFEIDSFLPKGQPAWDHLMEVRALEFNGVVGHDLRTVRLRKQLSQGLLLPLAAFNVMVEDRISGRPVLFKDAMWHVGADVTELLGVSKFEKPLSADLLDTARGYLSARVASTEQTRIQNMEFEFDRWRSEGSQGNLTWECTEKLEGEASTFVILDGEFRACSRNLDFLPVEGNLHWSIARSHHFEEKLRVHFGSRPMALRGELVGPGLEGNHYKLAEPAFYLYAVYDVEAGENLSPAARRAFAREANIPHVPVIAENIVFTHDLSMAELLQLADGPSLLNPKVRREGMVYQANEVRESTKVISNAYLLGEKL